MAHYRKTASGWRAQVERRGVCVSKTFKTKAEAQSWARDKEQELLSAATQLYPKRTVEDAVRRYHKEALAGRRNGARALKVIETAIRMQPAFFALLIRDVGPADVVRWREARLTQCSSSTLWREYSFLSPAWKKAVNEWEWCASNPWLKVKLPPASPPRRRKTSWREVRLLLRAGGFNKREPAFKTNVEQTCWAYMVALYTGLRSSEVLKLSRSNVNLDKGVYFLQEHKTDRHTGPRHVPLTARAIRFLRILDERARLAGQDRYFSLSDTQRLVAFAQIKRKAGIKDYRYHDARAAMLTWQSKKNQCDGLGHD